MNKVLLVGILFGVLLTATNCKKDKEDDPGITDFNRSELMSNVANNLIIPQYLAFQTELNQLSNDYSVFVSNQNSSTLLTVQNQWIETIVSWQSASMFEIGPAMTVGLRASIGAFPTDTAKVISNAVSGSYNLGTAANTDAIGLSSLDFMLFRTDALSYFSSTTYQQYGSDVIQKMQTELNSVVSQWQGSYKETFIAGTGTESTSGFSKLVNEFCLDYELVKNAKVGTPLGVYSLGITMPEYIEARYSGISLQLVEESIKASQRLFNGNKLDGSSGIGFDDYLNALEKSTLSSSINTKYSEILAAESALSGSFEENLTSNFSGLEALHLRLSQMVVMIKTDMPSSFGVLITYQDNDGD